MSFTDRFIARAHIKKRKVGGVSDYKVQDSIITTRGRTLLFYCKNILFYYHEPDRFVAPVHLTAERFVVLQSQ